MNDGMDGYADQAVDMRTYSQYNRQYADADVIQIRLNTDPVKQRLQAFLLGYTEKITLVDGKIKRTVVKAGRSKVNDQGLQAIMMHFEMMFNTQTVQGNMKEDDYWRYIADFHEGVYRDLWINMYDYGIDELDFDGIIASIMYNTVAFMSRTMDDGERKSYGQSMRSDSTIQSMPKKKGVLGMLGFG